MNTWWLYAFFLVALYTHLVGGGLLQQRLKPLEALANLRSRILGAVWGSRDSHRNRLSDTSLLKQAATRAEVRPPWNAPKWVWSSAWKLHERLIPALHIFDDCPIENTFLNLAVLWWKAISGNRIGSRTYDGGVAFDFLPPWTRWVVQFPLCWFFPDLHHQNVAIRTSYLDKIVRSELDFYDAELDNSTIVIVLGAGFDTRAVRFMRSSSVRWHEIDLPHVVAQKQAVLNRYELRQRKKHIRLPELHSVDLNEPDLLQSTIADIVRSSTGPKNVIVVIEAGISF